MSETEIAFIGSGNMGFALMKGIAEASRGGAGEVKISLADADGEKAKAAAAALGAGIYGSNTEAAEKGDYVFLAVKPQVLREVLEEIAPVVQKRLEKNDPPALVSMAAGWSIEKIKAAMGLPLAEVPIARIMPNTPALVSKGLIALAVSPGLGPEKTGRLETLLKGAGAVDRTEEKYLNAVTGLSGSGPAFVYLFIEALADGGVLAGLPRDKALLYAAQTVLGSAAMVMESGKHPGELKDMVCSPGGTTIAGVAALEAGGFRSSAIKAVEAAWRRACELA
ncbi:MAG: pyrroline-5-carboxylate reductase [Treponema sp.]|nr:pyrroline-5-carboxylate reductase [Treponema sp.]